MTPWEDFSYGTRRLVGRLFGLAGEIRPSAAIPSSVPVAHLPETERLIAEARREFEAAHGIPGITPPEVLRRLRAIEERGDAQVVSIERRIEIEERRAADSPRGVTDGTLARIDRLRRERDALSEVLSRIFGVLHPPLVEGGGDGNADGLDPNYRCRSCRTQLSKLAHHLGVGRCESCRTPSTTEEVDPVAQILEVL